MTPPEFKPSTLLAELIETPGEQRLLRLASTGPVAELLIALGDEAERLAVAEVSRALTAADLVVALADEADDARGRARARRARAQALAYAGRFDQSLAACADAVAVAEPAGEAIEAARARLASIHALSELGRYDEAVRVGEQAREAFVTAGRADLAARADINLGITHQNRDDPHSALVHFERARRALRNEPVLLGHVEINRGEALLLLSDFAGAEAAFLSALRTYEEAGLELVAAIAEGNLAELAAAQGMLQRALHHFERARRRVETDSAASHLVRIMAEQAEAVGTLGLADDSVRSYEALLPRLREHGLAWEEARAQAGYGRAMLRLGRLDEANDALTVASEAFGRLGHVTARGRVDLLRAELAERRGDAEAARSLALSAFQALRDRHADAARARHRLAVIALATDRADEAAAHIAAGMTLAEQLDIAPLRADLLHVRASLRRSQGDLDSAFADLRASIEQTERVRGALQADRFRAAYLGNRLAAYEDLVTTLLDRGGVESIAEAFAVAEQVKSRSLLDLVRGAIESTGGGANEAAGPDEVRIMAELVRIRGEINALYSRLSGDGRPGERGVTLADWQSALRQREHAVDELHARLSSTRGVGGLFAEPVGIEEARAIVEPGCALIEYFAAGRELVAFVVTRDGHRVVRGLADTQALQESVARAQFQLRRALRPGAHVNGAEHRMLDDVRRELHALWTTLIRPLEDAIDAAGRLTIVPHGPLHLLPFHALWDGGRFLTEAFEITYAPSASVMAHTAQEAAGTGLGGPASALVVGVADLAAPRIEDEARRVAGILGTDQLMVNGCATVDAVTRAAADAGIIHLACHGRFSAANPLSSGLRLSDQWLTARDVYQLRLRADLVTLSGCDTGRHLVTSGDEILGLVRGFLAAGASSLLVSLWTANDQTTAELMSRFYQLWHSQLSGPLTKAAALRQAQIEAMDRRPHPASWAPFTLVGRS